MYAENRGVKNYMKEDQRSNRRNFCSCGKESLKKNQACTGFEPLTSAILVQRSYQFRMMTKLWIYENHVREWHR